MFRPEFLKHDSLCMMIRTSWFDREVTKLIMNNERAARKMASDLSPTFSYGSSITETPRYPFTSTAFLSKIRKLYRERGDVSFQLPAGKKNCVVCGYKVFG